MISQRSIQIVTDTARIEEVVGDYVNLKRAGSNLKGLCPFHNEKTPSFSVSPAKNICKCFGCGKGGDPVGFLMEIESLSYPEAIRQLAKRYNIELEETQNSQENREERQLQESLYLTNEYAKEYFQDQLLKTDEGKSIGLRYFKDRGFRDETIKKFGLGFTQQKKTAFTLKATMDGYKVEMLKKLGLTTQYGNDFFRERVMFSIHNLSGKTIAFAGRILNTEIKTAKYINSPETEIYHKSKVLYGAFFAKKTIRKEDECILVEGYTDVISLHQSGIENVVASSGTSLTEDQIRLIKRFTPNVKILYDGDAAGVKAALRGLDLVLEQDLNVRVVLLPDGEDPDSYMQSVGVTAFREYIDKEAKDFILFKTDLLLAEAADDPVKKAQVVKSVVESIARIPDPIKRSIYIKKCAQIVDVEEEALVVETNKMVTLFIRKKRQSDRQAQFRSQRQYNSNKTDNKQSVPDGAPPMVPFPMEEPHHQDYDGEPAPPTQRRPPTSGNEFQERDIIRVLITGGDQWFDEEDKLTVAGYVLSNIEDVIDEFDHPLYGKIAKDAYERLVDKKEVNSRYFINHPDEEIKRLSINMIHPEFDMSPGWMERHEIELQTQPDPDKNFNQDSIKSVQIFKLRKIIKLIEKNQERMKSTTDVEEQIKLIKVAQHLIAIRNELGKEFGNIVALK